jgi:hypothetical protein
MDPQDLQDTLNAHLKWLAGNSEGECADLRDTNLAGADLHRANLHGANLRGADLELANLNRTNLRGTNLTDANLTCADLRGAQLVSADLEGAKLIGANLSRANLHRADFNAANLSGAEGLISPGKYLQREFETDASGMLCYKVFGLQFGTPDRWEIEEGGVIEENVNPLRTLDCACGVNVATRQWMRDWKNTLDEVWRCRIAWPDLASVVVPYNTDGKIRAERVKLLKKIDDL